jgi:hypothetical protein
VLTRLLGLEAFGQGQNYLGLTVVTGWILGVELMDIIEGALAWLSSWESDRLYTHRMWGAKSFTQLLCCML